METNFTALTRNLGQTLAQRPPQLARMPHQWDAAVLLPLVETKDGAVPRTVTVIMQARGGDLWVGTQGEGLVRLVEGDDLRNRLVLLTEAGAARLAAALPAWEAAQQKLIDRLGAEKRETLLALLDELA